MNIFASDLDQTLIYSKRWLVDNELEAINIEKIEDREISYILTDTINELNEITKNNYFIPVTTRTYNQYKRINFDYLDIKYAIVANGGIILENGIENKEWSNIVKRELHEIISFEEVVDQMEFLYDIEGFVKIGNADNLFAYLIVEEESFDKSHLKALKNKFIGWTMYDQGRKVYFVPDILQKGKALKFINEKLKADYIITAGDSLLDLSMIEASNKFIVPGHSKMKYEHKLEEKGIINSYLIAKQAKEYLNNKG